MKKYFRDKDYIRGNRLPNGKKHRQRVRDRVACSRAKKRGERFEFMLEAKEEAQQRNQPDCARIGLAGYHNVMLTTTQETTNRFLTSC